MTTPPVYETDLPFPLVSRGKVRDVYETPQGLLLVATDRLSAFDVVFPDPIPCKGAVLNHLAAFWFRETAGIIGNHLVTAAPAKHAPFAPQAGVLRGRSSLCRRTTPFPVECVVRGYLEGSAWKDYQASQSVCGIRLPAGLSRRARLAHPIFTPTTKAASGHDEPISFDEMVDLVGVEAAEYLRAKSLELYRFAHDRLLPRGILVSDTKFEFGRLGDEIILIDEALTPDSSRFWEADAYLAGGDARSLDKQYLRDYVESLGWSKTPPAPRLPAGVIEVMTHRYTDIFRLITGLTIEQAEAAAE